MSEKKPLQAENPLILRCHRLMEAFAKSDDERDFFLDRSEGFIVYADLDKPKEDLEKLEGEIQSEGKRYALIPKMTFYETKKIMEGFVNEKVYDIDTKEKLLEIIQSKEARQNFLDFIYDHHSELEKWQQYYQERSRIRIIEWLRQNNFEFVFEEDLDLPRDLMEKVKAQLFETKVGKDVLAARKTLFAKAKTYYSNEALNPRPKRGRPPKQVAKAEVEPQMAGDLYITPSRVIRLFLFMPETGQGVLNLFSQKFENEEQFLARKRNFNGSDVDINTETLNQKLMAIRTLSNQWEQEEKAITSKIPASKKQNDFSIEEDDNDEDEELDFIPSKTLSPKINAKPSRKPVISKPTPSKAKASPPKKGVIKGKSKAVPVQKKTPLAALKKKAAPVKKGPVAAKKSLKSKAKPLQRKSAAPKKPVAKPAPKKKKR